MKKIFVLFFLIPPLFLVFYIFVGIWKYPDLLPRSYNLRGIKFLVKNINPITLSIFTSLGFSLLSVVFSLLITILPASYLARNEFVGKSILEALLLSPVLIPSITYSMGIHWIFIKLGLSDSFIGVTIVLTMFSYPYLLRSLIAGFSLYSHNLDVSAKNLGANLFTRIVKVHLPLLLPSVISGGTVVFLSSFSSYFLVFLIGGGRVNSFTGYLVPFLRSEDLNISSVLSIIFLLIPIVLFTLIEVLHRRLLHEEKY
ncbi:MAG: ABC transporter permease subunit [Spirochaetaceae bacterium]